MLVWLDRLVLDLRSGQTWYVGGNSWYSYCLIRVVYPTIEASKKIDMWGEEVTGSFDRSTELGIYMRTRHPLWQIGGWPVLPQDT